MESGTSETFSKGSRVEVSSDEDGFKGAWYVATILESPPKSVSKKKSKALVEYQDLVADDAGSEPLTELVDTSFLRPLPPPEADANFCVNDLVDAFYRDGWWTGVITRISEDSKCTVFFQNPPDEIQFDRSDLRVHKEWVDGKWVRPEKQRTTGLIFSPGAAVEVTLNDQHDAWFPAIVCREIGLGSYVVQCQSLKNSGETGVLDVTVDNLHIRPSPPRLEGRKFGLLEKVDAFYDYGWWNGIVTKVLTGRRYVVFFKHTNIEKEFIHSDLRPHMEWVDGKWVGATQEVLGTTYSEEQLGLVLNNSNNTAVGIQLESSGAAIDDAGDKISHSTRSEKDRLEQPALYVENSTFVVTSNKKKMKETSSDDATPSRPSKKLKEGNVADAVMSHAAGQSRMSPIQTSIQEVSCGFATPIMGGTGSNQTEQPVPGNQFITKMGSPSQGKKIGNEPKSSELGNQSSNSVRRKGRPPKSHKIAQIFPAGEEAYTVQNAEGTAEKEHTTNNVDMDMAAGLPSNTDEATLAENPSHHLDESLKVMRYQKKDLNTTERLMSQETGKKEEGTVSTQLKRRGRPPKRLGKKNLETSSEGRAPGVLFKKSPKASSTGRSPKLPLKRSPRTSTREPKHPRASAEGTKQKGPKASSEGSNFNKQQMESEAGLDLNSPDASAAGKDDNEVVGGACEIAMTDCMMNEVETPMSTVAESSARRGLRTENAVQHSRRPYNRRHSTDQKPLGRPKNVQGSKTRTPRTRKQKVPDGSIGQASSKQLEKGSSKRGRRKSININSVPPTQGAQDALGETTAPVVEKDSKAKQVEMAVDGVHCVPDDQPLSMWLEGMHSPGMADNSKLSPDQTVIQWTEASGRPKPIEVTQSPRIDPTGEIMLDLNQSLPFVKCSPIWNTLETLEVFQKMPQKPHFRPLENCKEERREGLAIGNMVTFSTLIEKVAKLKFDDPRSLFSSSLEALVDLEMHGFDIKPVQRRINELVFIKDQQEQLKGKTKEVEDQITEHTHEKTKIDEEIYEIDKKMIVLQEKRALAMAKKESKDSDIAGLLSSVDAMNESIQTGRQDFERLATSPW